MVIASAFAGVARAADQASFDCQRIGYTANDNYIQVSGAVYGQSYFGPPGYGETPKIDEKHTAWIMKLDVPLRVYREESEAEPFGIIVVKEIQVVAAPHLNFNPVGRHAVAYGDLYGWSSGYHKRPILIFATAIREGGRIACDGSEQPLK